MPLSPKIILVGARESPLSKSQVSEVQAAIKRFHPHVELAPVWVSTTGDQNLQLSLRGLGKTDFFTKEIDALLLSGDCQIAIHSAKDLPEAIPSGLQIIALTQSVDSRDALVLRTGETFENLKPGSIIATSSERREEAVKSLRRDLQFIDLRGTIENRLDFLHSGRADGVVVAEAALIRLGLTHLNRIFLPGETTPLQGQLAILARANDLAMLALFSCLDTLESERCLAPST